MFSKTTFASIIATLALFDSSAALGINCRGSGLCPRASWDNAGNVGVLQGLRDAMYAVNSSQIPDSTNYKDGDHIICVSQSQKITISPGVTAGASATGEGGASGNVGASVTVGLSGSIGNGGICVFPQKTDMTLGQAKTLIDGLLEHKCTTCGSNPSKPGNNDATGELTVNYVASPYCVGNCISDQATGSSVTTNPSAGKTSRRWGKDGARVRNAEQDE